MQPLGLLVAAELRAAAYDVVAVVEEDRQHLLEAERARLAVDEGDVVDAERVLHRRLPVELLEQRLGDEAVLDLDHQPQAVGAVGEVLEVGDALELLALHQGLDPLDDLLGADAVGQLGDDDALARGRWSRCARSPASGRCRGRSRRRRGCRRARRSCRRSAGRGPGRSASGRRRRCRGA